ncbi:type II secretion system F family protein [Lacisediminihabitans changchengi]|uniref:Type II secretion system F family protein n=1 Tax=Lacisediminihabitans changchengi TaxID=2787634 RepID=A0A934SNI9_9MICO|nr:type II secretion system F family protein [Lacisediminihabitans changchengi]MBK4348808.1 type II secretion system F family protein [Lacisediminihabitans changchengi]
MTERSSFDELAEVVERLAVLLAAGVAPGSAWGYLAETGSRSSRVRAIAEAVATGGSVAESLLDRGSRSLSSSKGAADDLAWRGLAAAWRVATEAGAPLAPTLQRFAASLRDLGVNERDAQTALAGPRATTRLVMVLPVIGILFGLALGFDTVGTLVGSVPGAVCLVIGVALILVARWWSAVLIRRARPPTVVPGLALDLVAIAVSGGASIPRALAVVAKARAESGLPIDLEDSAIDEVLALSARAGVPAAMLLRSGADEARRSARSAGERKAATLAVTLMLPLGLCILPAFMLLAVAPLMLSVVSSTVGSL